MREGIGYRAPVSTPKQHEQAIAQCSKHMRGVALRSVPSVFAKRDIPHVMDRVLDRPMPAPQPFDRGCSGFLWSHTHQPIAHLRAVFATLELDPFADSSHDLLHIGPVHILDMCGATPQRPRLQAPMSLLNVWSIALPDLT